MMTKQRAEQILKEANVLLEGHFLYTSGRHGNQYMQCAQVLQYPDFTEELVSSLAEDLKYEKADVVIGPATGGIILSYELARKLRIRNLFAERENGKMTLRRGFQIKPGERVIIAEDVITTGGSVREVMDIVTEAGGIVAGVGVLVDRTNGKIDFGTKFACCYQTELLSYEAEDCPLCKENKIPLVKPGSRTLTK